MQVKMKIKETQWKTDAEEDRVQSTNDQNVET